MILLDFNGVVVGTIVMEMNRMELEEDLVRHMVLNSIRMYNKKFRNQYGQMVICCDGGSWRKEYFPQYKANRKKSRDSSKLDWDKLFSILNEVVSDIKNNFPYKVVDVYGAEADDIIAALVHKTQEFGQHEDVMIVSSDKDFIQLHKFNNVRQYSPYKKGFIQEKNPRQYIQEHIFKGDSSDGIPNVLSPDDVFMQEGIRQSKLTKKRIEEWMSNLDNLKNVMDDTTYRNYIRNRKMIDLEYIPEDVVEKIINRYEESKPAPKMKVLNYLIAKRCKQLIECVGDFH